MQKFNESDAEVQRKFLEPVFGTSSEFTAVVDSEDKYELRALLDSFKPKFEDFERRTLDKEEGYESRFWKYINSHYKMKKKSVICSARNKAGLPFNSESDIPMRPYTNQSESINNILTRRKEAFQKTQKGKEKLRKLEFV